MNLRKDFLNITKKNILAYQSLLPRVNYRQEITNINDPYKICLKYFNLIDRLIMPIRRTVHKSSIFYCPVRNRAGLQVLEQKIVNGDDVNPHLSRGLKSLDKRDLLLATWSVHHLHIETIMDSDGFIKRSGPILFALFTDTDAYFLTVMRHGKRKTKIYILMFFKNKSIKKRVKNKILYNFD